MSVLKRGLKSAIGGDDKNESRPENVVNLNDDFNQANANKSENPLETTDEVKAVGLEEDPAPEPVEPVPAAKVKKAENNRGNGITWMAFLMSAAAIGLSVYALHGLQQGKAEVMSSMDMLSVQVDEVATQASQVTSDVSGLSNQVKSNTDKLAQYDSIQDYINDLDVQIQAKMEEIEAIQNRLANHDKLLDKNSQELADLNKKVTKLSYRKAPAVKPKKAAEIKKAPMNNLNGTVVESIDTWGINAYVMLRDDQKKWVALLVGDKYLGWKLAGVTPTEAIFTQKGKEVRLKLED